MYTMISATFKSLGVNSFIVESKNAVKVEGIKGGGVTPLVHLFEKFFQFGY